MSNLKSAEAFLAKLANYERRFKRLRLSSGDPGQIPVTKLSGVPWWPRGTDRPICVDGHSMGFIAQIRLDEVPGFDQDPSLLSFHYCEECTFDGKMPHGWTERGRQRRYDVRVFPNVTAAEVDGLGTNAYSSVLPQVAEYEPGIETLSISEIQERFPRIRRSIGTPLAIPVAADQIVHEWGSKVGGWPSWIHWPQRPEDEMGNDMEFVGQLDLYACPDSPWCCGYAYLFASIPSDDEPEAELIIHVT